MSTPLHYTSSVTWEQLGSYREPPTHPTDLVRTLEDACNGFGRASVIDIMRTATELAKTQPQQAAQLVDEFIRFRSGGRPAGFGPNELIATQELQMTCLASGRWTMQEFCGAYRNLFFAQPRLTMPRVESQQAEVGYPTPYRGRWDRM